MTPRSTPFDAARLSDVQREVLDEVRTGKRGTVPANVLAWLPSPELARRAAALGEFVRYETSLPRRLSELAILAVARQWACEYEWAVHAVEAADAGVPGAVIASIARNEEPILDLPDVHVYTFARALAAKGRVPDAVYTHATALLGEQGVVDLIGVVGYYTLVAFTLNAGEVAAPAGSPRLG